MKTRATVLVLLAVYACSSDSDPAGTTTPGPDGGATSSSSSSSGSIGDGGPLLEGAAPTDGASVVVYNDAPTCTAVPVSDDLTSAELPAPPAVAGVSFVTDWSAKPESGGWKRSQRMDLCRYHGEGTTWHGKASARVEVRVGDDPLALGANSERAEMLGADTDETKASGVVFYAFSYRLPATWDGTFLKGDEESWSFVMQLYPWGGLAAGRRTEGGPQTWFVTSPKGDLAFTSGGTIALGVWTDFALRVDWATGHVTLWRRAEGEAGFTKEVDADGGPLDDGVYVKQGLYRGGHVSGRTDVLWVGPFARGTSFAGVETAAFATAAGQP